ncbi:MAG: type II toxin-antitoxin system Phd/YefM family antitoxin [Clostridia bacterium]|nr:type II toxin-antitoxin system Phd/YefM family antitoxin [Clostridia bacterium]
MNIVPMRDLKDTVRIEQLCAGDNGPVFVTKNGYGRLVVMDIDYFERTMRKVYEASAVNKGVDDLQQGKTADGNTILEEMRSKYGF